jgi:hypothetical protein
MQINPISNYPRGTLYDLLADAYSGEKLLVESYRDDWKEFDDFVFDNMAFMNDNGFVSEENKKPIGFMTWDPKGLPGFMRIGHNCIRKKFQGMGKGREQLLSGLGMIRSFMPKEIRVSTGNTDFFLPARRMYESVGFTRKSIVSVENYPVPEIVEYRLMPDELHK